MTESKWGDEPGPPPKKRRVPAWVWWGCGGGCLLMVLAATVLLLVLRSVVADFMDPEKAWAGLREILPYEERPEGWDARGKNVLGTGHFMLIPKEPEKCVLLVQRFRTRTALDEMFDPESRQNTGVLSVGGIRSAEPGTIRLQGRETRCLRFHAWVPEAVRQKSGEGASIRVDLTGQGPAPVQVQLTLGGLERVTDEQVATLLAPFDVWRGR